jgi:rare lipoprotein A
MSCVFLSAAFVFITASAVLAAPSAVTINGESAEWKIGGIVIWRFPAKYSIEALTVSERFNKIYSKGFSLTDLNVSKADNLWSLRVGDSLIVTALPRYGGSVQMNSHLLGLTLLSRVYEAVGQLHAHKLTPNYKIGGGFEVSSSVSWYGGKLIGRKFANGERFTESHLSAAAKSLPFGTLVKITSAANGRSVVVRITDRFAEHKNWLLDISQAAAELLGM